jgi:hypothetical protein
VQSALQACFGNKYSLQPAASLDDICVQLIAPGSDQRIAWSRPTASTSSTISNASSNLAVGTLQAFLDDFMHSGAASRIDYVHGVTWLPAGRSTGKFGFYLPACKKAIYSKP